MCGIAGILRDDVDLRKEKTLLLNMSETLRRRGPDGQGEYIQPWGALLHRRLSVIDPKGGAQPMQFGEYVISYNGEIYNTTEVRQELESFGYTFDTSCDTEVVLKAFHKWKEKSVEKLNGIFAYAILNVHDKSLFAARDRIGVKPLFYSKIGNVFAFASRINTLLCVPEIEPVVNSDGLNEIFMLGPAKTIGKAVYRDIEELPPAHWMIFKDNKLKIQEYWSLKAKEHTDDITETLEHTHFLVKDAIQRQLVADVPVATFLSGGLDSSIISKVAADYFRRDNEILHTFSVDYDDNDKYFKTSVFQPNKDSDYIGLMSDAIGSKHENIILDNVEVANALKDATTARCLPGFTDVDSSLLLFCRGIKSEHKVFLSGECADEIFGGYPWYHRKEILFEDTFPWSRSTDVRKSLVRDGLLKNGDAYVRNAYENTIAKTSYLDGESKEERRMREMFMLNMDWFMQTLLARKDSMTMESSLEVRVPFCDWRLMEYAYNMPWKMKALDGREKGILRKAFEMELPNEITWRKKSPYPKTYNPKYFECVRDSVYSIMADKSCVLSEMLNPEQVSLICENPDALKEPWYGQLMRGPQVLAYIVQIYLWIKENDVRFV